MIQPINRVVNYIQESTLLKKGISFLFIKSFGVLSMFLFVAIVSRYFGTDIYGKYVLALTTLQLSVIVGKLGLDVASLRLISQYKHDESTNVNGIFVKLLLKVIIQSSIVTFIVYNLAGVIAIQVFHSEELKIYIELASFSIIPVAIFEYICESLRALQKIKTYALIYHFLRHALTVLIVAGFIIGDSFINPILALLYTNTFLMVLCVFLWVRQSKSLKRPSAILRKVPVYALSLPLFISMSSNYLLSWIDQIMIGVYSTEAQVGIYNAAFRVSILPMILLLSLNSSFKPQLAEYYGKNDFGAIKRSIEKFSKIIFYASIPIFLIILLGSDIIMKIILGISDQEVIAIGSTVLVALSLGQTFNALSGATGAFFTMTGNQNVFLVLSLSTLCLKVVLNIIFIPQLGITGAAITSATGLILSNLAALVWIRRKYKIDTFYIPFK